MNETAHKLRYLYCQYCGVKYWPSITSFLSHCGICANGKPLDAFTSLPPGWWDMEFELPDPPPGYQIPAYQDANLPPDTDE